MYTITFQAVFELQGEDLLGTDLHFYILGVADSHCYCFVAADLHCYYFVAADFHCHYFVAADLHYFYFVVAADLHCYFVVADLYCYSLVVYGSYFVCGDHQNAVEGEIHLVQLKRIAYQHLTAVQDTK